MKKRAGSSLLSKDLDLNLRWSKPEVLLPGAPLFLGYIAGRYDVAVHEASPLLLEFRVHGVDKYRVPSAAAVASKET